MPKFLIPTIQENLKINGNIELSTLIIAAWCYYSDKETDLNGNQLKIIDQQRDTLNHKAKLTASKPLSFIEQKAIFGELAQDKKFADLYQNMVQKIYTKQDIYTQMKDLI